MLAQVINLVCSGFVVGLVFGGASSYAAVNELPGWLGWLIPASLGAAVTSAIALIQETL